MFLTNCASHAPLATSSCACAAERDDAPEKHAQVQAPVEHMVYAQHPLSVCPTAEEAAANACAAYSEERVEGGVKQAKGVALMVYGEQPVDGVWPTKMYKKAGILDGFVSAKLVAAQPDLSHIDAFERALASDIQRHEDPLDLDAAAWLTSGEKKTILVKNFQINDHIRGCALTEDHVECALVWYNAPMMVARWKLPGEEASSEWPVLTELIVTSNGWLYTSDDTVHLLMRPGNHPKEIELLTVIDRFGTWQAATK